MEGQSDREEGQKGGHAPNNNTDTEDGSAGLMHPSLATRCAIAHMRITEIMCESCWDRDANDVYQVPTG